MWRKRTSPKFGVWLLITIAVAAQDDTLKSALDAVTRREIELEKYPSRDNTEVTKYYAPEGIYYTVPDSDSDLNNALMGYLEGEQPDLQELKYFSGKNGKSMKSAFRERMVEQDEEGKNNLDEFLYKKLHEGRDENDYGGKYIWSKYKPLPTISNRHEYTGTNMKRQFIGEYYPNLGYGSIGMKKRDKNHISDDTSDTLFLQNYTPRNELLNEIQREELEDINPYADANKYFRRERQDNHMNPNIKKRFPVTKRRNLSNRRYRKRSSDRDAIPTTNPKVAKDLSHIFGSDKESLHKDKLKTSDSGKTESIAEKNKTDGSNAIHPKVKGKKVKLINKKKAISKEVMPESLSLKKKSVDWSDYFGYDRKKKSEDIDNEWLLERYHKAIAMARRSDSEAANKEYVSYPLTGNRNKRIYDGVDDEKLKEIDDKLKVAEETIVDEALKYTGAHEGATDLQEIEDVNDKVISHLAAAYSLEKMRKAIGEYKSNLEEQRKEGKKGNKLVKDIHFEEKRVSVPRKQAIDDEASVEEDNNIKCADVEEECEEEAYENRNGGDEVSEWNEGGCLKVERACREVANFLGVYGHVLEPACIMHQMCLLCGEHGWFAPTRQCNILFLKKSSELCAGDLECQRVARHSVRYLLDVNRSLRDEPIDDCDLNCPNKA